MSFIRHRETHQSDEHLRKRARLVGHALAHRGDESPVGYSWRVALQHCPLPLHQPRLIVRERSVEGKNFFNPAGESLNFLSHSRGPLQILFSERMSLVMTLLVFNVTRDLAHVRLRIRERTESFLPTKVTSHPSFVINES